MDRLQGKLCREYKGSSGYVVPAPPPDPRGKRSAEARVRASVYVAFSLFASLLHQIHQISMRRGQVGAWRCSQEDLHILTHASHCILVCYRHQLSVQCAEG